MQNYQLTVLITNKLDEKKRNDLLDDVVKSLGNKANKDLWGVRGLSYAIKHEDKAFYAHFDFESDPSVIPALDRKLKLNEDIVRYLLIKVDPKKESSRKSQESSEEKMASKKSKSDEDPETNDKVENDLSAEIDPEDSMGEVK